MFDNLLFPGQVSTPLYFTCYTQGLRNFQTINRILTFFQMFSQKVFLIQKLNSVLVAGFVLTYCLLVSSADFLCKQIKPRLGTT